MNKKSAKQEIYCVINIGKIGDVLVSTPLCKEIKQYHPNSKLIFISAPYTEDIVKNIPEVDDYFLYDKDGIHDGICGMFKFISKFKYSRKVDYCFIVHRYNRPTLLAFLFGAKKIISDYWETRIYKCLLSNSMYKNKAEKPLNILQRYAKYINYDTKHQFPVISEMSLVINEQDKINAKEILTQNGWTGGKLVPLFFNNHWRADKLINLITKLQELNYVPVVMGTNENLQLSNALSKCNNLKFINLIDKTILVDTLSIIDISDFVISVDTGSMHAAVALNKPNIALISEGQYPYWGHETKSTIIKSFATPMYSDISVEDVISKVQNIKSEVSEYAL